MRLGYLSILAIVGAASAAGGTARPRRRSRRRCPGRFLPRAEPAMEGVLVSAKKAGSTVTVTVVSDEQGRYSFPADRLEPGRYTISIRAIGYKLDGPKTADVAAGAAATADLKLSTVKNLVTATVQRRMARTACRASRSRRRS